MKILYCLLALLYSSVSFAAEEDTRYLFFLHNMFLETAAISDAHPEYGKCEYREIISAFEREGFNVISELRPKNTDAAAYAAKVRNQIDSLLDKGISPSHVTVVGTSKGAYIAWHISSLLENKEVNFVLIGICTESMINSNPHLKLSGNILSIYERSDVIGQSCATLRSRSSTTIPHYREIQLHTGLKHGFLYKALPAWIQPTARWAKNDYGGN